MKFRNYQKIYKTVEVQPSKIHKNGLFATIDFAANDIVI